jgi:hypothetical protein
VVLLVVLLVLQVLPAVAVNANLMLFALVDLKNRIMIISSVARFARSRSSSTSDRGSVPVLGCFCVVVFFEGGMFLYSKG